MDLPAFALYAEPLRRKFYRPKPVLASLVHAIGLLYLRAGVFLAKIKFAASGLRRDLC